LPEEQDSYSADKFEEV